LHVKVHRAAGLMQALPAHYQGYSVFQLIQLRSS
jgi:hypothetical protein